MEEIASILEANRDQVVVIDEAYIDFGGDSCRRLIPQYDNLLVCQTFSKAWSMAGGRLGFALGDPGLIADLEKIKFSTNPYSINRLTQIAAEAALGSANYFAANCRAVAETRAYTVAELENLGFETVPSVANFIFTRCPRVPGGTLYRRLKEKGVLVRHWDKPDIRGLLPGHHRVPGADGRVPGKGARNSGGGEQPCVVRRSGGKPPRRTSSWPWT